MAQQAIATVTARSLSESGIGFDTAGYSHHSLYYGTVSGPIEQRFDLGHNLDKGPALSWHADCRIQHRYSNYSVNPVLPSLAQKEIRTQSR